MNAIQTLTSAATELKTYIDKENERLKLGICSTDLDDPDYHDYQTCQELMELASGDLIAIAPEMYKFLDDIANGRGTDYPIEQLLAKCRVINKIKLEQQINETN